MSLGCRRGCRGCRGWPQSWPPPHWSRGPPGRPSTGGGSGLPSMLSWPHEARPPELGDTGGCRSLIPLGHLPGDQPSGPPGVGPRPLLGSERPPLSLTPRSLWPRPEAQGPSGQRLAVGGRRPARSPMAPLSPSSQFCLPGHTRFPRCREHVAGPSPHRARRRRWRCRAHRCDVLVHLHSAPVSLARALGPSHSRHGPRV